MESIELSRVRVVDVEPGPPIDGEPGVECILCHEGIAGTEVWSLRVTPAGATRDTSVPVCEPCADAYRWYVDLREAPPPQRQGTHEHVWRYGGHR